MRVTLNLDEDLYQQVTDFASREGRTVTSIVENALRAALAEAEIRDDFAPMPVGPQTGGLAAAFVASGVDLADTSAVLDFLDQPVA